MPGLSESTEESLATAMADVVARLRTLALRGLARMYRPDEGLWAFRVRYTPGGVVREGVSRRYTAIALIGLAGTEKAESSAALAGQDPRDICRRLVTDVSRADNLGDVALTLWAARAVRLPDRQAAWERLVDLRPAQGRYPVVEVAWALAAICVDRSAPVGELRASLASRLMESAGPRSGLFPHVLGGRIGPRSHVACFADAVYPVLALAEYARLSGDRVAVEVALRCARQVCRLQGSAGQWWWHYDQRTGTVIEPYPVYAVHQDAMAPMALFALEAAASADFTGQVAKGLAWLAHAPELGGHSLIDDEADVVWRKVARREPAKLARTVQAISSRIHPRLRAPGLDLLLPPGAIDYEDRPYHLGWLLYAWSPARVARWREGEMTP